jgi:hypothetical protein
MSLVDIGNNDNRSNAMPNNHDLLKEKPADGTTSWSQKVNVTSEPRFVTKDARIVIYDNTGIPRIFLGIAPEYTNLPILAVSKEGESVLTALGIQ